MSSAAVEQMPASRGTNRGVLRTALAHPDLILLGAALPVFILAGWSLAGYAVAAIAWIGQSLLIAFMELKASTSKTPRAAVGLMVGGSLARAWLSAIAILIAGVALNDAAGLACALLLIVLFTVYFVNKLLTHHPTSTGAK